MPWTLIDAVAPFGHTGPDEASKATNKMIPVCTSIPPISTNLLPGSPHSSLVVVEVPMEQL